MFEGKVWWITGASSGIGAALAEALAAKGAHLILSGRNEAALRDVAARVGGESLILPFEATDFARVPGVVEQAWAWRGRVDGLVNNAGIVGAPLRAAYSAAKAGIIGYHDSVRAETTHQGMRVLVVAPGSVKTNVSKNALDGQAQTRGFSDTAIDNGMAADVAASTIVSALENGTRELILAEGMEAMGAALRRSNPNQLFDVMAKLVADGYAKKLGAE